MAKVYPRPGESIDAAVIRFTQLCKKEGLKREIRDRMQYTKPSQVRRLEKLKGIQNSK